MDQKAKELDVKYQQIWEIEKRIRLHKEAMEMLRNTGLPANIADAHIASHMQMAEALKTELEVLRKDQLDDFMYVESLDGLRILNMRYLENLSWDQITELTGNSRRWLMKIRDKALSEIVAAKKG